MVIHTLYILTITFTFPFATFILTLLVVNVGAAVPNVLT